MANEVLHKEQTAIVVADLADYAGDIGSRTDQLDLTSIASGASRQSDKVDLAVSGSLLAQIYKMFGAIEADVAPISGETFELYGAFSPSAVAGTANPGGCSGSDGAYTGTGGDSMADSLDQLEPLGLIVATADAAATVQFGSFGVLIPLERYVCLVFYNNTSQALEGDAIEGGVRLVPAGDEIQ